jgi:hypothetical protein
VDRRIRSSLPPQRFSPTDDEWFLLYNGIPRIVRKYK